MQGKNQMIVRKKPLVEGKYVIKIEGQIKWEGKNPQAKMPTLMNKNPGKAISISWKPDKEFLIV